MQLGAGQVFSNLVLGDEPDSALPIGRGVVENVVDLEAGAVVLGQEAVELLLAEDIFMVDVGVDEREDGAICWVLEGGADDLYHGGDAGASSDHADVGDEVGGISELAPGTLDTDGVANLESREMPGDVTFFVRLDEEFKVATVVVGRDGGVGPHNILAVDLGRDGNVLANGEAENIVGVGQAEAVTRGGRINLG